MRTGALILAVLLAGCGLDPGRVPALPVPERSGDAAFTAGPLRFAVVGAAILGADPAGDAVRADLAATAASGGLAFAVLTGDQIPRSSVATWTALADRWIDVGLPLVGLAGVGEARGDRRLRGYGAALPGLGEPRDDGAAGWGTLDRVVGGVRWRLVWVETERPPGHDAWQEQRFWLPGAVSGDTHDRLLLFLPTPATTLTRLDDPDDDASQLLDIALDHTPVDRLMAVFQGGTGSNELMFPDGGWGHAMVVAGNSGTRGAEVVERRPIGDVALHPVFTRGLREQWGDPDIAHGSAVYPGVAGWWWVELDGRQLELRFRAVGPDGEVDEIVAVRFGPTGWGTAP